MKKSITLLLMLGAILAATTPYAAEKDDSSLGFWEKLRRKIELMAPHKNVNATTAVGGVRGAQVTADDTYWKGENAVQHVDPEELASFQKAMGLVETGEVKQAQAAFADFIKKYPASPLRKDADQALAQLQPR